MFQDSLNTYVVNKFNENTKGLTAKGDYMFMVDNGKFVIKSQTGFSITETEYIPVQIEDWNNTAQPFKRIDLQDLVAPISFAIRQTQLSDGLEAIEEFRLALNGASATIDGLNVGFRVGQPSSPSSPLVHAGEHWIILQVIIMLSAGANLTYGNGIEFKIAKDGETLEELVYAKLDISTVAQTSTDVSGYKVGARINKSTITINVDIFYEDNTTMGVEFLNALWQETSPNQTYDISVKYSDTVTKTMEVRITSITQHIENGVPIGFAITLNRDNG